MQVKDYMHTQVTTVTPETLVSTADQLMTERGSKIRHLPVVSGKRLVGIITDRDIREASPSPATTLTRGEITYQMATIPMRHCMTEDVVSIGPDMDMVQATRLLLQRCYGCLPVVDHGALVGIITEIDCLWAFLDSVDGS